MIDDDLLNRNKQSNPIQTVEAEAVSLILLFPVREKGERQKYRDKVKVEKGRKKEGGGVIYDL